VQHVAPLAPFQAIIQVWGNHDLIEQLRCHLQGPVQVDTEGVVTAPAIKQWAALQNISWCRADACCIAATAADHAEHGQAHCLNHKLFSPNLLAVCSIRRSAECDWFRNPPTGSA